MLSLSETNISQLGSTSEIEQRVKAAKTAEEWQGAGEKSGIQIWRIENLRVKPWPQELYGTFYDGDTYIILNTDIVVRKEKEYKSFDVHFWLGSNASIDENGIAAYKSVELGTLPGEHRELQGSESEKFKSYFPKGIKILNGGIDSGFKRIDPEQVEKEKQNPAKLLQIKGKKTVYVKEVDRKCSSLNEGDVFVLVTGGDKVFIWNGKEANRSEKYQSNIVTTMILDEKKKAEVIDVTSKEGEKFKSEFFSYLEGNEKDIKSAKEGGQDDLTKLETKKKLYKLSNESGSLKFELIAENENVDISKLNENDVFILDVDVQVFIWIGKGANNEEKRKAMPIALDYVEKNKENKKIPISREAQGVETITFLDYLKPNVKL